MSDDKVERWVREELHWDPKIDDAAIAVSARDGEVILRGTVGSFREKRDAKVAAKRVYGVRSVENELQVKLLTSHDRKDADLRGSVLQAIVLDRRIPKTVDASVTDGWVTLDGTVDWQYQRDEAERVAGNIDGIAGVDDRIVVRNPEPGADGVESKIAKALERNAKLDAKHVVVATHDGTVSLGGTVSSWADHDAAVAAAWSAPGVTAVEDNIRVDY